MDVPGLNGAVFHTFDSGASGDTQSVAGALSYINSHTPSSTYAGPSSSFTYTGNDDTPVNQFVGTGTDTSPLAESIIDLQGLIPIPAAGTYTFTLNNDDGGAVFLGGNGTAGSGTEVVDNGGSHGTGTPATGTATFSSAGIYPIEILYYDHNPNGTSTNPTGAQFAFTATDSNGNALLLEHAAATPLPASALGGLVLLGGFGLTRLRRRTA